MRVFADDFLKIGSGHPICQDYAISDEFPIPHVIVSDGCSSSEMTDMGARILAFAAKKYLLAQIGHLDRIEYETMGTAIIRHAESIARELDLPSNCLDATLLIGYLCNEAIHVHIFGDGVIGLVNNDFDISITEISFTGNAPYYLSYRIDEYRNTLYRQNGYMQQIGEKTLPPDSAISFMFPISRYATILLSSDGIGSFINSEGKKLDMSQVMHAFTAFKNYAGQFLTRRVKRAIQDFQKTGWNHYDDVGVGAFCIRPEPELIRVQP
jgi:hypothetical protein